MLMLPCEKVADSAGGFDFDAASDRLAENTGSRRRFYDLLKGIPEGHRTRSLYLARNKFRARNGYDWTTEKALAPTYESVLLRDLARSPKRTSPSQLEKSSPEPAAEHCANTALTATGTALAALDEARADVTVARKVNSPTEVDGSKVNFDVAAGCNSVKQPPGIKVNAGAESALKSAGSSSTLAACPADGALVAPAPCSTETPRHPCLEPVPPPSLAVQSPRPKRWRDYTDVERCVAFNAVTIREGGYAFTLNLGTALHAKALVAPKGFTDFMRRRIARRLNGHVGRDVEFWFSLDITDEGRLHFHGGIIASPEERGLVKGALELAGGTWEGRGRNEHQVVLKEPYSDYWAVYSTKRFRRAGRRASRGREKPVEAIAATNGLRATAAVMVAQSRN